MIFIFPTHNYTEGLKKFIKFNFSNSNIIVSDSSKNNEIEKLCQNFTWINYFRTKYNVAAENWNFALSNTKKSSHLILIHDDEYINHNDFNKIKDLKKTPNEIYLLKSIVYRNNKKIKNNFPTFFQKFLLVNFPKIILFFNFIGPTGAYIFYQNNNNRLYYDTNLKWLVDIEFFYRISRNKKIIFLNNTVRTDLKEKSLTSEIVKKNSLIYFKELLYIKKKYRINNIEFILYLILSLIFRLMKRISNIIN